MNVCDTTQKYDVTLWFAILHHVLASKTPDDVLQLVRSVTKRVAVIEIPVANDVLLQNWVTAKGADKYTILADVDSAREWLKSAFARVDYCGRVHYNNGDSLNRHAFVCHVI